MTTTSTYARFASTSFFAILLALAGCSGSNTPTDSGSNDVQATDSTTTDTAATDSNPGTDSSVDAATTPTCAAYCARIMAACTGSNQQYTDMNNCMNSCLAFPVGAVADTSGDTLGCRLYHAGAAGSTTPDPVTNAMTHCPHAGPGGAGVCGANCAGFCDIATRYCLLNADAGTPMVYANRADCMTTCMATPDDLRFNVTDVALQAGAHVACLLYHVQEASSNPPDHCGGDLARNDAGVSMTCSN